MRRCHLTGFCLALLCAAACAEPTAAPRASLAAPGAAGPKRAGAVDPRDAWALLVKRSEGKAGDGSGRGKGGVPGAPGAQGPPRVPMAAEELLRELQRVLRGTGKERAVGAARGAVREPEQEALGSGMAKERLQAKDCGECEEKSGEGNVLALVPSLVARSGPRARVEAAFRCRTRRNISVEQRSQRELQIYYIPEREGTFHRGLGLNLTSGQYTAPVTGYYAFAATLHIVHQGHQRKGRQCGRNRLRVLICVQSLCQRHSSLETVSQLESSGDLFTVSVNGVLYLQAGQYASVFVDNTARSPLTVQSGSGFSAVLLGE